VGIVGEGILGNDASVEEVFLDDLFEDCGGAGVVPDGFGINDGDGAEGADAEAVGLGTIDQGVGTGEFEFLEALFEVFPGLDGFFPGGALGIGGIGAKENMAPAGLEAEGVDGGLEFRVHSNRITTKVRRRKGRSEFTIYDLRLTRDPKSGWPEDDGRAGC
jgi:hypothetical protein